MTNHTTAGIDLDLDKIAQNAHTFRDLNAFHPGHFQLLKNFAKDVLQLIQLARRSTTANMPDSVSSGFANSKQTASGSEKLHVECRECSTCGHVGINDSSDTLSACHNCDWSGAAPEGDYCAGCAQTNCMGAACPKCGALYRLLAESEVAKASGSDGTAAAGAPLKLPAGHRADAYLPHVIVYDSDRVRAIVANALAAATSGSELAPDADLDYLLEYITVPAARSAAQRKVAELRALAQQAATCQPLADERALPDGFSAEELDDIETAAKAAPACWYGKYQIVDGISDEKAAALIEACSPDTVLTLIAQARAGIAQQAVAAAGYKLVPIEPTPEMIAANGQCNVREGAQMLADDARATWKAMLAAAPSPSAQDDQDAKDAAPLARCAAGRDGECGHAQCPQLRDGEPAKSGRHCPIDNWSED